MKKLLFLLSIGLCVLSTPSWAQENCSNGIDDDGDNKIDCYDLDCLSNSVCDGFYLNRDADCSVPPPEFPQFTMTLDFASPNETTNHIGRMAIGDLDRDGMPEIVTMNRYTQRLIILNGNDGSVKRSVVSEDNNGDRFTPLWEIAIANIDNDNCAELFFQGYDNGNELYLYSYDCDLNFNWKRRIRTRDTGNGDALDAIMYGLADFDGDGKVELYVKDMILDAHTGTVIINTATSSDNGWNNINGGPVAADILGDDDLELILGCRIYDVDLGTRAANSGTLTLLRSVPNYYIRNPYNATSVADYNQDGFLDVLASGSTRDGSSGNPKNTTIFFWDVHNDVVDTYSDPIDGDFTIEACPTSTGEYYKRGWRNGTGRLNISDLDGDGNLNVSYVSGKFLYALDHNLDLHWKITVNEETSGFTGCTLFDFNGDRKYEVVYRDERYLYIIDGTDGSIYSQQACISRTQREYPIVADVDADGSTELCVTCGFDDQDASDNFCDLSYSRYSHVRVFKSAAEPWVPARRLWNQHGYFNVNVNDNLTIPRNQQKHHLIWANSTHCTPGPNRPLNGFLNQSPFLDTLGCPIYATPNLAHVPNTLDITEPTCPDEDFAVSFRITNLGDIGLSGNVPITFYNGDPEQPGAVKLNTVTIVLNDLEINQEFTVNATVNGPGSAFELFIVLNDAGTTVPTPISLPNTNFYECEYGDNIISGEVIPEPVDITAVKVADNLKCGVGTPDNGAVRAFVPDGSGENSVDYNFYWSNGTVAKPVGSADFVGSTYTGLADGTYTVYAIHKTANCNSDTTDVDVGLITETITVTVVQDNPHDNCTIPNGVLRAVVNGGEPESDFTYEWYRATTVGGGPNISFGASASGLAGSKVAPGEAYTVIAIDKVSGCSGIFTAYLLDETVRPVVTPNSTPSICSGNSGGLTADVGGATAGFTFKWYNGGSVKPMPDFTGPSHSNKAPGTYTVVATNNTTGCDSDPVQVTVGEVPPPVVTATTTASQTSCEPTMPNGSASAHVGGVTTGYTFEWFTGQNTENSFSNQPTISGQPAGIYTVKVTDINTGCFDTEEVTINSNIVIPAVAQNGITGSTSCSQPNGSIEIGVTLNGVPDDPSNYTFTWYNGPTTSGTPLPDTDHILNNLPPGEYTVKARHNTNHCETAPITVTVMDNAPIIDIILDEEAIILPGDCNQNNGFMTVSITAPGNTSGFDVEWYFERAPFTSPPITVESGVTVSSANSLKAGVYTVVATNKDNGCQNSEEFDLPFANAHRLLFNDKEDVFKCINLNSGWISVELNLDSVKAPVVQADYVIHLYEGTHDGNSELGDPVVAPLRQVINGGGPTEPIYTTNADLEPGYYTLVAISTNSLVGVGCRSVPVTVEIEKITNDPVIVETIEPNRFCPGASPAGNGSITLTLSGDGGSNPADYIISWHTGPDTSTPVFNSTHTPQLLTAGTYTVLVTNNNSLANSTGCSTTATYFVPDSIPVLSATVPVNPVTACPDMGSSASITVRVNGEVDPLQAAYDFEWFDEADNPAGNTNSINDVPAGTYYVQATNPTSNCTTGRVQIDIEDMTIGTIGVELASFVIPTQCLKPQDTTGVLTVNPIGTSLTGYDYSWLHADGTPTDSTRATLLGIEIPAGQTSVTHIIEVTNRDNGCTARDTITLPLDIRPITMSVSSTPLTSCISDNGLVFATVTSGSPGDYDYTWSTGVVQPLIDNLGLGDYTVVAVDRSDLNCQTQPLTVNVGEGRVDPVVTAMAKAPLVNCDPTKPNGVATASVGGDIINYSFDWFQGPSEADPQVYTGVEAGQLPGGLFTVRATHNVTGCTGTAQVTIMEQFATPPVVQIEVLSHKTSCIDDNGALAASVDGNTGDYIFDWYIGDAVKTTPDNTGEYFYDLSAGIHTVTATSRATGCVSAPVSENIIENPLYPDFAFMIVPATCGTYNSNDPQSDGDPDGVVSIAMTNAIDIGSIEWDINGISVFGPVVGGLEAGTYSVTVTSALGCATTKEVEVKTEIHPFNGISRDGNAQNDRFWVNCIDNFPDNIVRIYNRAGTLVYEAHGYDNIDIYFDGQSNRGVSMMGTNLPDGTYFYVVDKMDGSKAVAGYLEIVN